MQPTRLILTAATFVATLVAYPLSAQTPGGVTKTNDALENGERLHFSGRVADINPPARTLVIEADSLPSTGGAAPGALPYNVPKSVPMDRFHKGDRVTGEMVLRKHLLTIINVRLAADGANDKRNSTKREMKNPEK